MKLIIDVVFPLITTAVTAPCPDGYPCWRIGEYTSNKAYYISRVGRLHRARPRLRPKLDPDIGSGGC